MLLRERLQRSAPHGTVLLAGSLADFAPHFSSTGVAMGTWFALFADCIATLVLLVAVSARGRRVYAQGRVSARLPPCSKSAGGPRRPQQGFGQRTEERHISKDLTRSASETTEFECKPPNMARVLTEGEVALTKGDVKKSAGRWRVLCYNKDYAFELGKKDAGDKFSVVSFESNANGKSKIEKPIMARSLFRYLRAPFYLDVFPMSAFLERRMSPFAPSLGCAEGTSRC